jgi:hypothetical protein
MAVTISINQKTRSIATPGPSEKNYFLLIIQLDSGRHPLIPAAV